MENFTELQQEMAQNLPVLRGIVRRATETPDVPAFFEALRKTGLDPCKNLKMFLEMDGRNSFPKGWEPFWEKAEEPIKEHTPQTIREAETALEDFKFYGSNTPIWIPREKFRSVIEAVMREGGRGSFQSGEDHFWQEIRGLSHRNGGPYRIPKGWAQYLKEGGLPEADPYEVLQAKLGYGNGKLERNVLCDLENRRAFFVRSLSERWADPEAHFSFKFPDGSAVMHDDHSRVESGFRGGMLHPTRAYSYGAYAPRLEKGQLDHWARFLLTPERLKAARAVCVLVEEAERQGTTCFHQSPKQ